MKTIRMRHRALILLAVCGIASLFLLKTYADDSPPAPKAERIRTHPRRDEDVGVDIRAEELPARPLPPLRATMAEEEAPAMPALPPRPKAAYPDFGEQPAHAASKNSGGGGEVLDGGGQLKKPRADGYPLLIKGKFIPPNKIVHFDLKGAAPKAGYFKAVFKLIKQLGGTGVLMEWEDMFPFTGELAQVAQSQAYTAAEIRQILGYAKDEGLDIIPLVQTFGHLEYILKFPKWAKYRQVERYPQVICLGDDEAVQLVKDVVDQVMSIHGEFAMPYFHMGADEAFQIGMCEPDQTLMRTKLDGSRERLMLRHIAHIADYVKTKYKTQVLMWHDMLNNVDNELIKEYKLGELVEPVVWMYAESLNEYLQPDMWQRFGELFPYMWGGSAFKGADGPSRYYSNVPHYLQNHISWVGQMTQQYNNFKEFRGLILTGWQRFDHFAVLCEIWPVGIPSLAVNLATVSKGLYDRSVLKEASRLLGCSSTLDIDAQGVGAYCTFPGAKVYQQIQSLRIAIANIQTNLYDDYQVQGWLSRFNIRHNYSQPWYLDQINDKLQMYLSDLQGIHRSLREEMPKIFSADTVDEWIYEYVEPDLDRLNEMAAAIASLSASKAFPARPFPIKGSSALWRGGQERGPPRPRAARLNAQL